MNITRTGNNTAAAIEPTDTILVNAINSNANTKHIKPICQFIIKSTPSEVAIPLPPLNLKKTGKVCPIITNTPASCTNKALSKSLIITPASNAIRTATTPFNHKLK